VRVRQSLAADIHDHQRRKEAKSALRYPPVHFNGAQARAIARGFESYIERSSLVVWACAILPEHVHVVIARHRHRAEYIVNQMKGAATRSLNAENIHPLSEHRTTSDRVPKMWARGQWIVYLNTGTDIERSIRYVEQNPAREGLPPQDWWFVQPFDAHAL
jgi:REP element-mobilizing transposase RayT